MLKIFVVILNWNRAQDTIECLRSVSQLRVGGYELRTIVVDNASSDDSIKKIAGFDPELKIIKNNENLGFAEGNNVGVRYALQNGADYVLVLNNDTLVAKNLVKELLQVAEKHKNFGAASPKIYFAKGFEFHKGRYKESELGKVIWYAGGDIDWQNVYGTTHGVDEVDKGQFDQEGPTDFATGTAMFLSAQALKKVGLFDRRYYLYFEDTELSQRLKKAGFAVLYAPKGIVWHKVAQSSGIGSGLNDYFLTRNRLIFGLKYAPFRAKLALIKESIRFLIYGRPWQKIGVRDFYLRRWGRGSWK
jgi:GT2 family glycosyltransferase